MWITFFGLSLSAFATAATSESRFGMLCWMIGGVLNAITSTAMFLDARAESHKRRGCRN
jgi:hypothetical protein